MEKIKEYHQRYYQSHKLELCALQKQYDLNHKEEKEARNKKERAQLKRETIAHYSNNEMKCSGCGIRDIDTLCIDHINGNGNRERRLVGAQGVEFYRWLRKNNYPAGYQILCANCNLKKQIEKSKGLSN